MEVTDPREITFIQEFRKELAARASRDAAERDAEKARQGAEFDINSIRPGMSAEQRRKAYDAVARALKEFAEE